MKKIFLSIICLLCVAIFTNNTAFAVTVPANTPVKVALKRHKSQRTISSANQLQAVITKNVYINGQKVFAKNTPAIIHVALNDKAKFFCKGGTLILKGVTTTDVKGEERKLTRLCPCLYLVDKKEIIFGYIKTRKFLSNFD